MLPTVRPSDSARTPRHAVALDLWCALLPGAMAQDACSAAAAWPLWEQFTQRFMRDDGRVIDYTTAAAALHLRRGGRYRHVLRSGDGATARASTSFGPGHHTNLAGGDQRAPARLRQWGRKADGSWGVVDANPPRTPISGSAYALAEAGRVWH